MTTLLSLAQTAYGVGSNAYAVTVPAALTQLSVSLTRVSWPAGAVATMAVVWSDGSGSTCAFQGGTVLNKQGAAAATADVAVSKQAGTTQGVVTVNVLQALTTALTVTGV